MTQTIDQARKDINGLVQTQIISTSNKTPDIDAMVRAKVSETTEKLYNTNSIESLTHLINHLDEVIDLKMGIVRTSQEGSITHIGSDQKSKVVIRDARFQSTLADKPYKKPEDTPQSFQALIAAQTRGILKVIELDKNTKTGDEKEQLKQDVLKEFYKAFSSYDMNALTTGAEKQKQLHKFNYEIGKLLKKSTLEIGGKKFSESSDKEIASAMGKARDFANFEAQSPTIITISPNIAQEVLSPLYSVTASVPLKPVDTSKTRYTDLDNQKWFKDLTPVEKELTKAYSAQITDGQHTIPTQLRNLAGIKNGYLEQTSVIDNQGHAHDSAILLRSGTLAHNLGAGQASQELTGENIEYIKKLSTGKNVHLEVLNPDLGPIISAISSGARLEKSINNMMMRFKSQHNISNNTFINPFTKNKNLRNITDNYDRYNKNKSDLMHVACKSGKDRTGFAAFMCGFLHISSKQNIAGSTIKTKAELEKILAQIFHHEEVSSSNTIGVKGLRSGNAMNGIEDIGKETKSLLGSKFLSHASEVKFSQSLTTKASRCWKPKGSYNLI